MILPGYLLLLGTHELYVSLYNIEQRGGLDGRPEVQTEESWYPRKPLKLAI